MVQTVHDYNWTVDLTTFIRRQFDEQCHSSYKNTIHYWKQHWVKGKAVLDHCDPERYVEFCEYWDHDETKAVVKRNSINRISDRDGMGIATHNNGGKTFEQTSRIMAYQISEEPDLWNLFKTTHTNKKTNKVEDKKVRAVLESFKNKRDEILTQRSSEPIELSREEIDQLVIELTPRTKGRSYGLGSLVTTSGVRIPTTYNHLSHQESEELVELHFSPEFARRSPGNARRNGTILRHVSKFFIG